MEPAPFLARRRKDLEGVGGEDLSLSMTDIIDGQPVGHIAVGERHGETSHSAARGAEHLAVQGALRVHQPSHHGGDEGGVQAP